MNNHFRMALQQQQARDLQASTSERSNAVTIEVDPNDAEKERMNHIPR